MLDSVEIIQYKGRPVLMYRWSGSNIWFSIPLD